MFTATEDDVDVLMSGYAFRLKISHERALSLVTGQSKIVCACILYFLLSFLYIGNFPFLMEAFKKDTCACSDLLFFLQERIFVY